MLYDSKYYTYSGIIEQIFEKFVPLKLISESEIHADDTYVFDQDCDAWYELQLNDQLKLFSELRRDYISEVTVPEEQDLEQLEESRDE